jgi:predicted transposase/invertase (TIGR01784 family)
MRRDSIFFQLFQQLPTLLFQLLPLGPANAEDYTFSSVEVKETSFRIDGVFIPPNITGIIYFCEVQFQLDELLYERMLSEISIHIYRNRALFFDWRAVIIYPSRSIEQSHTETVSDMLASGRITRVYLDELGDSQDELTIEQSLMVLTILEGDAAIDSARELIARPDAALNQRAIIDLVSTIMVYKFTTLTRDEVNAMLGIELQQTRVYQDAKAEGIDEGRQATKKEIVMEMLIEQIPLETIARLTKLSIEQVQKIQINHQNSVT